MIAIKLMGGLGNQMFQFATGWAIARSKNSQLWLDTTFFTADDLPELTTPREFELDVFGLEYLASMTIDNEFRTRKKSFINLLLRLVSSHFQYKFVRETSFEYNPFVVKRKGNIFLEGYWQSPHYFQEYRQQLICIFTEPLKKLNSKNHQILSKIQSVSSISLHIRRGDYVSNSKVNSVYIVLPVSYYKQAVEIIFNHENTEHSLFIFSDDPEWCMENLIFPYPTYYISHNTGKEAVYDLLLMSQCRHHVIANSSFSWWGAWLATQPGLTVAPVKWFSDSSVNTDDLIPEHWIRI